MAKKEQIFNRVVFEPMGVSQWKEYGKKYGYWEYFEDEIRKETLRDLES